MGRVLLRLFQVAIFLGAAAGMTALIVASMPKVPMEGYGCGWPAATGIFVLGLSGLVARAASSAVRCVVEDGVSDGRAARIRKARPQRPQLRRYDSSVLPLAREAIALQREIVRGAPLEGSRLDAVASFKDTLLSQPDDVRATLEWRGIDTKLFARRLDEALLQRTVLRELLEVDRVLSTLLVALVVEVPSSPYRS